jgi:DNA-binding GntR family transcriptional regulator
VSLDFLGKLDPIAQEHPSRQIAAKLREAIHAGRFAPSGKLPSQPELAAHFRVARETVKRALDQLRTERLIMTRQGAGAFVIPAATDGLTPEQRKIYEQAEDLAELLRQVVPSTTIHWAVEEARRALRDLSKQAGTIHTNDTRD